MNTKTLLFLLSFFSMVVLANAGDRNQTRIDRNIRQNDAETILTMPYNTAPLSIVFLPALAQGFTTDSISVGPEIFTGISGFYDYKTNGETNVDIQVDPANPLAIHVVDVQADSTDATGVTTRRTKYAFSTNGGATWEFNINVPDVRSGYGVLQLLNSAAVVANHSTNVANSINANLYVDVAPLAGTFNEYSHPSPAPFAIWPQIAVYGNGNVGMVGRRNVSTTAPPETLYYSVYNGTTLSAWTPIWTSGMTFAGTVGSNCRFHIASNGQSNVTIVIAPVNEIDTLDNSKMFQRTSTDNGVTWGPVTTVFAPYTVNSSQDTVATAGGSTLIYKKNTTNYYMAFPVTTDNLFSEGKLMFSKNGGAPTTICSVADVGGATTFNQAMAFVFTIDFPALGFSADGSTLYCVYSVVKSDTSRGFNQRDLYAQFSLNDGTTWSTPVRLTNTPTIDETYPSVSSWNAGTSGGAYELNLAYMKDPGVGPSSFNGTGTLAPISRNSMTYRKITGINPIGISNNQSLLKDYHLAQNYPNPFNPTTKIEYNLVKSGMVNLKVYDVLGREVASLVNEVQTAGVKSIEFNAQNLPSGIYIYKIEAGSFTDTKKMILVK